MSIENPVFEEKDPAVEYISGLEKEGKKDDLLKLKQHIEEALSRLDSNSDVQKIQNNPIEQEKEVNKEGLSEEEKIERLKTIKEVEDHFGWESPSSEEIMNYLEKGYGMDAAFEKAKRILAMTPEEFAETQKPKEKTETELALEKENREKQEKEYLRSRRIHAIKDEVRFVAGFRGVDDRDTVESIIEYLEAKSQGDAHPDERRQAEQALLQVKGIIERIK